LLLSSYSAFAQEPALDDAVAAYQAGKTNDAKRILTPYLEKHPKETTYEASSFLLKHKLYKETLQLLDQASRVLPEGRELLLATIQARWPEWNRAYLLKSILLQTRLEPAEARRALDTAIALGANTPEAYCYQALSIMDSAPEDLRSAQTAIRHALPRGRIALARNDYNAATAHFALRDLYTARGDESKASDELKTIKRISSETGGTGDVPVPFEDLLFTVHR
jgi:hypothetical protein